MAVTEFVEQLEFSIVDIRMTVEAMRDSGLQVHHARAC